MRTPAEIVAEIKQRQASRQAASERATPKTAGPAKVIAAVATGSLPVSRAEALCEEWEDFALALECNADTHGAETVRLLVKDLRREMGLPYPRQPEENTEMCNEPKNGGATS